MSGQISVLDYLEFSAFLDAFIATQRASDPSWSYAKWARELKIKTPSTLIMIANGQRHPGPRLIQRLIRYFKFNESEAHHFCDLVKVHKARDKIDLGMQLRRSAGGRKARQDVRLLNSEEFRAISYWPHYAVRELVNTAHFKERPQWIADRLKGELSGEEVNDILERLLRLGLLKRDATTGHLSYVDKSVDTPDGSNDHGLRRFHGDILKLAGESLKEDPASMREISGLTFSIRTADLPRIKKMVRDFEVELASTFEAKGGDDVYHLEVAFFPLTVKKKTNS